MIFLKAWHKHKIFKLFQTTMAEIAKGQHVCFVRLFFTTKFPKLPSFHPFIFIVPFHLFEATSKLKNLITKDLPGKSQTQTKAIFCASRFLTSSFGPMRYRCLLLAAGHGSPSILQRGPHPSQFYGTTQGQSNCRKCPPGRTSGLAQQTIPAWTA